MAIHSHAYNWSDGIDTTDTKPSLLDANTSIDPTFSQAQHSGDSAFQDNHVAQAVAKAQQASRQAKSQEAQNAQQLRGTAQMLAGQATQHTGSPVGLGGPQLDVSDVNDPLDIGRQGRPLTNTKRAQQNRQAQRAFRQRKELYIKDLESKFNELKQSKETIDALRQENIQLRDYILALQSRLIEHPGGVPTPPAVYARQNASDMYEHHKSEK